LHDTTSGFLDLGTDLTVQCSGNIAIFKSLGAEITAKIENIATPIPTLVIFKIRPRVLLWLHIGAVFLGYTL